MPSFVVVGRGVGTDPDFSLNDLCGSTGRLDVLLRCVNSAFMLSNDIRRDVDLYLLMLGEPDPPRAVLFRGRELKYLNPDERSTAALVKNALMILPSQEWMRSTPGIYTARRDLAVILGDFRGKRLVYLKEEGETVSPGVLRHDDAFVLGGKEDLDPENEALLHAWPERLRISLGPRSLHADHCITVALNALDRA